MSSKMDKWDGFFMVPGENEDEYEFRYFTLKDETKLGEPIENTDIGYKYHVALFKGGKDENGEEDIQFNDCFEAIFIDPVEYASGLMRCNFYGTFLKKTENSCEWFDNYLKTVVDNVKLLNMAKSISES